MEVIRRPKFTKFPNFKNNADFLLARISEMAESFEPTEKVEIIRDSFDNRFLELAQISNADFIITGNTTDFTMKYFGPTRILTPREFWENYR